MGTEKLTSEFKKQTIILSRLDKVASELKNKHLNPEIVLLGQIKGRGENDYFSSRKDYKVYSIRQLNFGDYSILEQFVQTKDKDLDDYIISERFKRTELPKNWKIQIMK